MGAGLLDLPADAITVQGSDALECFENHQSECALPNISFFSHEMEGSTLILESNRKNGEDDSSVESSVGTRRSGAGVGFLVGGFEAFGGDVGVDLGGDEVGVA